MSDNSPNEKPLRTASFAIHATRGLVRDPALRRKMMFWLLAVAVVFLVAGFTFLHSVLNPHEHPLWFILFWIVCGWVTFTAILMALFDLLMVRLEARRAQRQLHEAMRTPDSPRSTSSE